MQGRISFCNVTFHFERKEWKKPESREELRLFFFFLLSSLSLSLSSASRSLKNHTSTTHKMKFVSSVSAGLCYINVIRTMFPDLSVPITLEIRVIKVITRMEDTFSCLTTFRILNVIELPVLFFLVPNKI